ncbi:hypothetical protein [Streptomyces sp. MUM 178J]|uniref:hypothetical protein n=1 Tax=Streptomyces sp. MUM 178J TaxID=2791991 RepID=UPI001F03F79D|nr:hypothetical protein [Streptomyces sp. MUM 178J]WRQ82315.1 hypothetical protein I3F59_024805 [Streptomyces sp. MUM 178J]
MLPAWSPSRTTRSRPVAGALRLLWLAAALLAFLLAHGVGVAGATGHAAPAGTAAVSTAHAGTDASADANADAVRGTPLDEHGDHGPPHDAPDCVPGQPSHAPAPHGPGGCVATRVAALPAQPPAPAGADAASAVWKPPGAVLKGVVLQV